MIVDASAVCFSYPGTDRPTLADVNLSIPAGGALGLMGLNGAGKTTLLKLICGVLEPSAGSLQVLGSERISRDARCKSRLGVMHQKLTFDMMLPAIENLKISARLHGRRWSTVRVKAAELCSRFSLDDEVLHQITYTLSGGQMRRLQLVRAVLYEPRLLVVDEPTTGLDVVGRKSLWSYLADLRAGGTTLLMCSHYPDEIEAVCDRVIVLDNGRVVVQGTAEEVRGQYAASSLEDAFLAAVGHIDTGTEAQ
ncbi:ABC transporter ATP-binding protein [Kribbella sp. NPDC020789]